MTRKRCEHGNDESECSRCNLFCDPQCGEWYCDEKEDEITRLRARIAELERDREIDRRALEDAIDFIRGVANQTTKYAMAAEKGGE